MKVTTNFPYEVDVDNKACKFDCIEKTDTHLKYEIITPQNYFAGLDNNMKSLLEKGYIEMGCEVNCSSTLYRKWFKTNNFDKFTVTLDLNNLAGKFTLQVLIIVIKEIEEFGILLKKGMPLAILGDSTTSLEGESSPIFNFQEAQNDNISYNLDSDCIVIYLPKKHFEYLQLQKENPTFSIILISHFAQLALKEALKHFTEDDTHADLNWYVELKNKWKDFSKSEDEFPTDEEHQAFIDFILKDPSLTLVDYFITQSKIVEDDED